MMQIAELLLHKYIDILLLQETSFFRFTFYVFKFSRSKTPSLIRLITSTHRVYCQNNISFIIILLLDTPPLGKIRYMRTNDMVDIKSKFVPLYVIPSMHIGSVVSCVPPTIMMESSVIPTFRFLELPSVDCASGGRVAEGGRGLEGEFC